MVLGGGMLKLPFCGRLSQACLFPDQEEDVEGPGGGVGVEQHQGDAVVVPRGSSLSGT